MTASPEVQLCGAAADVAVDEAARRRTFAVISHPDAGKSTLTEALALHARVIAEAGAVHGKSSRRGVVSDWLAMEQARGISITSAALQFAFRDRVINLLDTPGHADFSEDTYRVLAAVDCAVMLLDAAKGLELQTLKLFEVCRYRRIPVITFVNKWDRPGREALDLMDEIEQRIGLQPTPLTWPVGIAGDFRGVLDRREGQFVRFTRTAGGATRPPEERLSGERAAAEEGAEWSSAAEEVELLAATGQDYDQASFLAGQSTPVLFGAALPNFGVGQLLDVLLDIAPSPVPRADVSGTVRALDAPFSGFVFKVQAGMDRAHRDRIAFMRVCSGVFERGMVITHAATGRPFATKYAQQVFGRKRSTVDTAYPGDIVGLVNASALRIGDTLYDRERVVYPGIPSFAPEHFAVAPSPTLAGRSSSVAPSTSWSKRTSFRCCARITAVLQHRCSLRSGRCSSRSSRTGWSTSSGRRRGSIGSTSSWRGAPVPGTWTHSAASVESKCSSEATVRCWPCSATYGAFDRSNGTIPI